MSDHKNYRTKDEWFAIIKECRKSGMTDAQWCLANGVNHHSFYNAIKRLRKCSYAIPEKKTNDIFDLTLPQNEYSGAAEPPFRKIGNRESGTGNRHTDIVTFASLLA